MKTKEINDKTFEKKVVAVGDIVYDKKVTGKYYKVIDTFEKTVFSTKKNLARISDGRTFVNSNDGINVSSFIKWVPEIEKFVVINNGSEYNEYIIKRVKSVNLIKEQVTLYDNSIIKISEISPFIGEIL